jgi:hypothetical protein
LSVNTDKHFLGYGITCVVLDKQGGGGPHMVPGPMQRQLVQADVKKLWELGGRNSADKLLRFEPQHALIFGISGKTVNKETLTVHSRGPFTAATWLPGASTSTGYIYGGQHRIAALALSLKETLDEFHKISQELHHSQNNQDLITKQTELKKILKTKGTWLVAFYDTGII